MKIDLTAVNICIIGGDQRYLFLAAELLNNNAKVKMYGYEKLCHICDPLQVVKFNGSNLISDLKKCDALILPITGVDPLGKIFLSYSNNEFIYYDKIFEVLKPGIPILVGIESEFLKRIKSKYNLNVIPFTDIDEYAIYNSISTAEGAVEIAMKELPITIHGSRSMVLGYGRVGMTLSRLLKSFGSETTVVCRNNAQRARSYEMGCNYCSFNELNNEINKYDIIFNTIPRMILNRDLLSKVSKKTLIIDLASNPGGTDFKAAEEFKIKALLALGLPGKTAPESAGKILGKVISKLLYDHLKDGGALNEIKGT